MHTIRPAQIKAARALLGWSQGDLAAAASLSVTTIRNLESGEMSTRSATANIVCVTIEDAGIEFIEPEGVRRRSDEIKIYQGSDDCDMFFEDMLQVIKEKGGEVIALFKSQEALFESCGTVRNQIERLKPLAKITTIKCLLSEVPTEPLVLPSFQLRTIQKYFIGPSSFFVYGNKYVVVLQEAKSAYRFAVFTSTSLAQDYKNHFFSLWDSAHPFLVPANSQERRVKI